MRYLLVFFSAICFSSSAIAEESKNLLKPTAKKESWRLELQETTKGEMESTADEIHFNASEIDGTNWHVQVFQTDLDLEEGKSYTVTFKAHSPDNRGYSLVAMIDQDDWHEIGLHEDLTATKEVREEKFTFVATGVAANKNRIGFVLGDEEGTLIVKDMVLTKD